MLRLNKKDDEEENMEQLEPITRDKGTGVWGGGGTGVVNYQGQE